MLFRKLSTNGHDNNNNNGDGLIMNNKNIQRLKFVKEPGIHSRSKLRFRTADDALDSIYQKLLTANIKPKSNSSNIKISKEFFYDFLLSIQEARLLLKTTSRISTNCTPINNNNNTNNNNHINYKNSVNQSQHCQLSPLMTTENPICSHPNSHQNVNKRLSQPYVNSNHKSNNNKNDDNHFITPAENNLAFWSDGLIKCFESISKRDEHVQYQQIHECDDQIEKLKDVLDYVQLYLYTSSPPSSSNIRLTPLPPNLISSTQYYKHPMVFGYAVDLSWFQEYAKLHSDIFPPNLDLYEAKKAVITFIRQKTGLPKVCPSYDTISILCSNHQQNGSEFNTNNSSSNNNNNNNNKVIPVAFNLSRKFMRLPAQSCLDSVQKIVGVNLAWYFIDQTAHKRPIP